MKAHSTKMDAPILFGSCLVGIAATILLVAFAQVLGFRIPIPSFLLLVSLAVVTTLLLPEYWSELRSRIAYVSRKYPLYVLLLVGAISRLIFGIWTGLFPDEYSVLDLLRRIPVSDLGYFLTHYVDYAGTLASHPPLSFLIMLVGYVIYPSWLSVRLISAVFSLASVFVVYGIVTELGKKKEALLVALLYAIVPHSLMFMDLALTDVYMNFFGLLGIWFILRSLRKGDPYSAIVSGVSLGLCFWSKEGLPFFWAILLLITVLAFRGQVGRLIGRLQYLALAFVVAFAIFGLWWVFNPIAFILATYAILFLVMVTFDPSAYQVLSKNISVLTETLTTTTVTQLTTVFHSGYVFPVVTFVRTVVTTIRRGGPLYGCESPPPETDKFSRFISAMFPRLCKGGLSFISYQELLVQIPFWITPLILLFSLFGIFRRSGRARTDTIMTSWALLPLLAMIPWVRDIRYLLLFTPAVSYLAVRGLGFGKRDFRRRLLGLALTFALIFDGVAFVVAQQQYYGPPQAVQRLQELGLEKGPILTNWVALQFELPTADVHQLHEANSTNGIRELVLSAGIKVAVLFHNARSSPPSPSSEVRSLMKELFLLYYKEGPSEFAWFEMFYNATGGQGQLTPAKTQAVNHSWAMLHDSLGWSDQNLNQAVFQPSYRTTFTVRQRELHP